MIARLFIFLLVMSLCACSDLWETGHGSFISSMDIYVKYWNMKAIGNKIVTHGLKFYPDSKLSKETFGIEPILAKLEDLKSINKVSNNIYYHYSHLGYSKSYCNYHFIVNANTMMVIGWGFDKGNNKDACQIRG